MNFLDEKPNLCFGSDTVIIKVLLEHETKSTFLVLLAIYGGGSE